MYLDLYIENPIQFIKIQALTKARSVMGVINDAIAVYDHLVQLTINGDKFYVGSDPEHLRELVFTPLKNIRTKG